MKYYIKVLKDYAKFSGRANRSEYWYFILFNFLIALGLGAVGVLLDQPKLSTYYQFATLVPSIAVAVRRMHDVDKSGWFLLIPVYNLILAVSEGTKGENKFGENP